MTERGRCSRIHFLRSAFSKETSPSGERYPLFSKKTSLRLFCVSKIAAIHRIHFFTCGGFLSLQDTALAWRSTPRPSVIASGASAPRGNPFSKSGF